MESSDDDRSIFEELTQKNRKYKRDLFLEGLRSTSTPDLPIDESDAEAEFHLTSDDDTRVFSPIEKGKF